MCLAVFLVAFTNCRPVGSLLVYFPADFKQDLRNAFSFSPWSDSDWPAAKLKQHRMDVTIVDIFTRKWAFAKVIDDQSRVGYYAVRLLSRLTVKEFFLTWTV